MITNSESLRLAKGSRILAISFLLSRNVPSPVLMALAMSLPSTPLSPFTKTLNMSSPSVSTKNAPHLILRFSSLIPPAKASFPHSAPTGNPMVTTNPPSSSETMEKMGLPGVM